MSNAKNNEIREKWLAMLAEIVASEEYCFTDALRVGPNELSFPVLDDEENREEIFVNVKVSIMKGTRKNGGFIPYDGYQAAEDYAIECEVNA